MSRSRSPFIHGITRGRGTVFVSQLWKAFLHQFVGHLHIFFFFRIIFRFKSQFSYPSARTWRNSVISFWFFIICASEISRMINGPCVIASECYSSIGVILQFALEKKNSFGAAEAGLISSRATTTGQTNREKIGWLFSSFDIIIWKINKICKITQHTAFSFAFLVLGDVQS